MSSQPQKLSKSQETLSLLILGAVLILAIIGYAFWLQTGEEITGTVIDRQVNRSLTNEDQKTTYFVVLQSEDGHRERFTVTQSIYRQMDNGEVCTFTTHGWEDLMTRPMNKPSCR